MAARRVQPNAVVPLYSAAPRAADVKGPPPEDEYVDVKTSVTSIPKAMKMAMAASKGSRNGHVITVKMVTSSSYDANASGVVLGVLPVDPSVNTTEWAAFTALYDQYRVRSVSHRFWSPMSLTSAAVLTAWTLCFDGTDATAMTGVRETCEYEHHKLMAPTNMGVGGGLTYSRTDGQVYTFAPPLPKGTRVPTASVPTRDEWATTAAPVAYGYIKSYGTGWAPSMTGCWQGINTYVVQFRMRS